MGPRRGRPTLTRDDVVAFSNGRIAHFKIPRYLHVTDDFPMTVTGKIQKYKKSSSTRCLASSTCRYCPRSPLRRGADGVGPRRGRRDLDP